jgi:hypothetical protein
MRNFLITLAFVAACEKKAPPAVEEKPPIQFVGHPVKQAADFPKEQWVRTTTFDGKPFLGFTYVDRSKGNCIKGEPTDGVAPEVLSKKLQGFPGYSMESVPAGHAMTLLTPEEIKTLKLPTPPDWVSFFK